MWKCAVLLVSVLAGCTSLSDIRQMPAAQVITIAGQRAEIAGCLTDELRQKISADDAPYDVFTAERDGKAYIQGRIGSGPGYAWETSLAQVGTDVRVEVRSRKNVWGNLSYPDRDGTLLRKCAAA